MILLCVVHAFVSAVMTSDTFNKGYQILGKNQDNEMVLYHRSSTIEAHKMAIHSNKINKHGKSYLILRRLDVGLYLSNDGISRS